MSDTTVDLIVFGFIALSILVGLASGFDGQIKRLGKGIKGAIITGAIVFVWGAKIMEFATVQKLFDSLSEFLIAQNLSVLGSGFVFGMIKYSIMYAVVGIAIKVVFEILGATFAGKNNANVINKVLGGALAGAISIAIVMLAMVVVANLPDNVDVLAKIQSSNSHIFWDYNLFFDVFGIVA